MLEIRDNGRGFDTSASFPGHLGLHSMNERVTKLGGTFQIESIEGKGTVICIHIPARGVILRVICVFSICYPQLVGYNPNGKGKQHYGPSVYKVNYDSSSR